MKEGKKKAKENIDRRNKEKGLNSSPVLENIDEHKHTEEEENQV